MSSLPRDGAVGETRTCDLSTTSPTLYNYDWEGKRHWGGGENKVLPLGLSPPFKYHLVDNDTFKSYPAMEGNIFVVKMYECESDSSYLASIRMKRGPQTS